MILGKGPRPPIKRTTSMTEFTLDHKHTATVASHETTHDQPHEYDHRLLTTIVSPRNHRRNSVDCMEKTHFLNACQFCNRRLITGRDIFMYRGDSAFCSFECRTQQMNQDEKKEKHSSLPNISASVGSTYSSNAYKID